MEKVNKKEFDRSCLLRISIGLIYVWFGMLKFFPDLSPAEELAKSTIDLLTFHLIPTSLSYRILAVWETLIGALLILNFSRRIVIQLALFHMFGTFTPLFLVSDMVFGANPITLTLVGQYIMKNLVIVSGLIVIYPKPTKDSEKVKRKLIIEQVNQVERHLQHA